ncbi:MAG: hypothetical protein R3Y57_02540 [Erysipelotrichaceae bacterium]
MQYINEYGEFLINCPHELVVCGEIEWEITFTPSKKMKKNSSIKVLAPAYQHQCSEEYFQTYDYWKPNYIYAYGEEDETKVDVKVEKVDTDFSHLRKWNDSSRVAIIIFENGLNVNEKIHIKFGGIDRPWIQGACKPTLVTPFAYKTDSSIQYQVFINENHPCEYKSIDVFPKINILPDKAVYVKLVSSNLVNINEEISYKVFVMDRFNNPIKINNDQFEVTLVNLQTKEKVSVSTGFKITEVGYYNLTIENCALKVENSAIICHDSDVKVFWGDTHCHSNLSPNIRDNDCGATPYETYTYARDIACLDYVAISEQTFELDDRSINVDKEAWKNIGSECDRYNEEGKFVTFSGLETHEKRGDTIHIFKNGLKGLEYPLNKVKDVFDMWEVFKDEDSLSIPHFHRYCNGRKSPDEQDAKYGGFQLANWEKENEKEVLCEIFSGQWGRFENQNHPMILKARKNVVGNSVQEFLKAGKKWGLTSNSDGHDGNPGYSGVTGVFANSKTREDIFKGLKNRRTIASTSTRVITLFYLNDNPFNNIYRTNKDEVQLNLRVVSPTIIKYVEIIKNSKVLKRIDVNENYLTHLMEDQIEENDYYYIRIKLQNNHYAWASPIWVEKGE